MTHLQGADWLGYIAAILVFVSFYAKTIVTLRLVAITSNMAFIGYAVAKGLYPVLILHVVLLPLNCVRLVQLRSSRGSMVSGPHRQAPPNVKIDGAAAQPTITSLGVKTDGPAAH